MQSLLNLLNKPAYDFPFVYTESYDERIEQLLSEYTKELERTDVKKEGVGLAVTKHIPGPPGYELRRKLSHSL